MELVSPMLLNIILGLAIITGLAISIWWVISLYWLRGRDEESESTQISLPGGIKEEQAKVPPSLIVFYVFIAVTMIGYIIYAWLGGITY